MCPIPQGCETPSEVSVASAGDHSEGKFEDGFLEVKNQEEKTDSFPYNFTACISTMFDFTNVLQLVQSLEMLQILGVNRVVIYKTNCSLDTQRVLHYYTHKGLVEVIPWSLSDYLRVSRGWLPKHGPGQLHYFGQIPALNDCLYRYMYRSRYVAFHDIDELILPQAVNSWLELMPRLERKFGPDSCYKFENNVFPVNFVPPPHKARTLPQPQRLWEKVSGPNILAHLYQEPIDPYERYKNYKIIVNPRSVFSTSVHGVLKSKKDCTWVYRRMARIYHTRLQRNAQLTPDQMIYDGRLLNYSDRLIPAVNTVLRESGLLPEDGKC
ncbi:uncharacterized protein PAE49_002511 [Odontesthes bonariensis]